MCIQYYMYTYIYIYIYIISYNFYLCLHIRGSNKQTWQHLTQVAGTTVHPLLTPIMKPWLCSVGGVCFDSTRCTFDLQL